MSNLRFYELLGVELEQAARRRRASRRSRLWAAIGASGVALAGGIVAAVLALSAGAPVAYAEWSRVPTTPSPSVLETAVHKCYKTSSGNSRLALPAPGGTMRPVLAEARGASAAAIYVMNGQVYMCLTVNGSARRSVDSYLMGPSLRMSPGPDKLSFPYGVSGGSGRSAPTHPLTKAQARRLLRERLAERRSSSLIAGSGNFALGQAGSGVSAVRFAFTNRETVVASVQNGWYFAWWPWLTEPISVTVTTSTGTLTSPLGEHPHDGLGLRPYPACHPGSGGCVFAANQPAANTTVTSTRTTTTPVTTGSRLATATQTCDASSMSSQTVPADVFVSHPTLTDVHGTFAALFSISKGKLYGCLTGGDQADVHAFFDEALAAFGPVHLAPGPDQLSVPYPKDGGGSSGRSFGGPHGRRRSQAEIQAELARLEGGGYGPYTLGQAGRDVSAVRFTFANHKTIAAIVANGWYFAWWPWISKPTSVTVTTGSGPITSPLTTGTNPRRSPIAPGCNPGSRGCIFDTTPRAHPQTSTTTTTRP